MIYTNQALNLIIVSIIDVRDPDEAEIGSNPDCLWLHVLPNSYFFTLNVVNYIYLGFLPEFKESQALK